MAGYDTAHVARDDLSRVIALSREEGRKIISRNAKYHELQLANDFLHLIDDDPYEQFRRIVAGLGLPIVEADFLSTVPQLQRASY